MNGCNTKLGQLRRRPFALAALALSALALSACDGGEGTSLLVEIRSDLGVPDELDGLRVQVTGNDSGGMLDESFSIEEPFPHSYRVRPRAGRESESLEIIVTGTLAGASVIRRNVDAAFSEGSHETIVIELTSACAGVVCPEGVDCVAGRCDGAVPDAGVDDAGVDASVECDTDCDDGIECTVDSCERGSCVHDPDDTACTEDGEICQAMFGCARPCDTADDCDDGLVCTGTEGCFEGRCTLGEPLVCEDDIDCTVDACTEPDGCVFTPDATVCDDGNMCNGAEVCDPVDGCTAGAPPDCDDANECTDDSCVPETGCAYITHDGDSDGFGDVNCPEVGGRAANDCDDGNAAVYPDSFETCNGDDDDCDGTFDEDFTCGAGTTGPCATTCDAPGAQTGTRVCGGACSWSVCSPPVETCNGLDDDCNGVADDGEGMECVQGATTPCTTTCGSTGTQRCDGSCSLEACVPPAEICEDGIDQDCNGVDDGCVVCTVDSECDDGLLCNGQEHCFRAKPEDPEGFCVPGDPVVCDDDIRCTVDSCSEDAEGCVYAPDDSFCDDSNFCNGAEVCDATLGCGPGTAPDCDDSNACTDQTCVGTTPGMCVLTTLDADGDGFGSDACPAVGGVTADDCNDAVPTTFPGAPELCNGVDDDCDVECDETFACCQGEVGPCETSCDSANGTSLTGTRVCSTVCSWGLCSPPAETCNGLDDDCNGGCDDGFTCCLGEERACDTTCGTVGTETCGEGCGWGACEPPVEICNGIDDNCDEVCDEGFGCCAGEVEACDTVCDADNGTTLTGTRVCASDCGGFGACEPPVETCNGLDDDCDGNVDEDFECEQGAEGLACDTTCGTVGAQRCSSSCTLEACIPPAEICENGFDENCDGVDNGCTPCVDDAACDDGLPCNGVEVCVRVQPTDPEGFCVEGDPLVCDDGVACTVDACDDGMGGCVAPPSDGLCDNGNFCDGVETCDAEMGCQAGTPPSCDDSNACTDEECVGTAPGACVYTTRDADGDGHGDDACPEVGGLPADDCDDAVPTTFTGATELCNGVDDNCVGGIDETFDCTPGGTQACDPGCGSVGSQTCGLACTWGTCQAPDEGCNGADEDCDMAVDEDFECQQGATGLPCTTSCDTTGTRACSASCTLESCVPPAEVCNGLDDDCDMQCDNGFTCCQGTSETCTTVCGSTGNRDCGGSCSWGACVPPAEVCNGLDDDCDGSPDNGFTCAVGATQACTTACGTTGLQTCDSACGWGVCVPPAEVCNGLDDDCDGLDDDGFVCEQGVSRACSTSCGSTGTQSCASDCSGYGTCTPPAEVCTNSVDDDCDDLVDCDDPDCAGEIACMGCTASDCSGSTSVTLPGGRFTVTLGPDQNTGDPESACGVAAGSEASLTFTVTEDSDVFAITHGAGLDTVLYLRSGDCCGTEVTCNDDADEMTTSVLRATSVPPGTYTLLVDSKSAVSASFTVDLYVEPPGVGMADRCANPAYLPPGTTGVTGNTTGYGADYAPADPADCGYLSSGAARDQVAYFYLSTTRTVEFNACNMGGSADYDTTAYIRSTCTAPDPPPEPLEVACNDDGPGGCSLASQVSATLSPGVYYFVADGWGSDSGPYTYAATGL